MGLACWRFQPALGHLQDLQTPQGTESPILNAADLVLVQLPEGGRQREHYWSSNWEPRQSDQYLPMLPATGPDPKLPCAHPCQDSQVLEVGGPTESFPGDGLDEVLTQVPAEKRHRNKYDQCLQSTMPLGTTVSTGRGSVDSTQ